MKKPKCDIKNKLQNLQEPINQEYSFLLILRAAKIGLFFGIDKFIEKN